MDVDIPCEDQPVILEEHAVEDDMDVEDDFDIEVDPILTPLQIVKPKGWKPSKTEFRSKLPVLRRSSRHVEINPPSPGNINDVIIENAELLNEINQGDEFTHEANDDVDVESSTAQTTQKQTLKKSPNKTPKTSAKKTLSKSPKKKKSQRPL